jgi:hypothetical protein
MGSTDPQATPVHQDSQHGSHLLIKAILRHPSREHHLHSLLFSMETCSSGREVVIDTLSSAEGGGRDGGLHRIYDREGTAVIQ